MIRTQIYLSEEQRALLANLAARKGENVSGLIRKAIEAYLSSRKEKAHEAQQERERIFSKAFGMWKDNNTDFATIRQSADRLD